LLSAGNSYMLVTSLSNRLETQVAKTMASHADHKRVYVPAAVASAVVFVLYLVTLAPSVTMWDTGEYMAATKVLGVPLGGGQGLALAPYLLTQGFVQKLVGHPLTDTQATPYISGMFVDVARTEALWNTVYRAPKALMKEGDWVDRASSGIPYTYAFVGMILVEGLSRGGNPSQAKPIIDTVNKIAKAARLEGFPSD
jgi:hypothetical protein